MKTNKLVLSDGQVLCPCCGYSLRVGATVRLKATREIGQMPLIDDDEADAIARMLEKKEAERHG